MKNRKILLLAGVFAIIILIAAVAHLTGRTQVGENCVQLQTGKQVKIIDLGKLPCDQVTGIRVNGKGEQIPVAGQGISVEKFLALQKINNYSTLTVIADDTYNAFLTADEISQGADAYFLLEDGQLRLVVFSDSNSKRHVSNVKEIIVE